MSPVEVLNRNNKNHRHRKKDKKKHQLVQSGIRPAMSVFQQRQLERRQLPIYKARDQILKAVEEHNSLIVVSETGSGKTTQIPQFLLENYNQKHQHNTKASLAEHDRASFSIAVTQPRRVAAISLAQRVSEETGCTLGETVGYAVRFDDKSGPKTRIKYMTDGMLLREALGDPLLSRYKVIILDEAHERTLRTDILFGLVKRLQQNERKDLKVIVMSATLDAEKFSTYFNKAQILHVAGRQYPTRLFYTVEPQSDYVDSALVTAFQIHLEQPAGDILIFLTGQEEIESLEKLFNEYARQLPPNAQKMIVCPLFANMPTHQQSSVFEKTPHGCRKIILSTNVAETSVTIPGVKYVIDTGMHKVRGYISRIGIESLAVQPISKAAARQRMGRAGREGPGFCYRLFTEESFKKLEEQDQPEIMRCNMASVILLLKASGVNDVLGFDYIDKPPRQTLIRSLEELYGLDALDDSQNLTPLGKRMAEFPLDPPFAKVLIRSKDLGSTKEIIAIISLLSVDSIFYTPNDKRDEAVESRKKFSSHDGDHLTLLNALRSYHQYGEKDGQWCRDHFINNRAMSHVLEIQKQLTRICEQLSIPPQASCQSDYDQVLKCFLAGFFNKVALRQPDQTYKCLSTNQTVYIHPSSLLFQRKADAVMYNELILTSRRYMRCVSVIMPQWLLEVAPKYFSKNQK